MRYIAFQSDGNVNKVSATVQQSESSAIHNKESLAQHYKARYKLACTALLQH